MVRRTHDIEPRRWYEELSRRVQLDSSASPAGARAWATGVVAAALRSVQRNPAHRANWLQARGRVIRALIAPGVRQAQDPVQMPAEIRAGAELLAALGDEVRVIEPGAKSILDDLDRGGSAVTIESTRAAQQSVDGLLRAVLLESTHDESDRDPAWLRWLPVDLGLPHRDLVAVLSDSATSVADLRATKEFLKSVRILAAGSGERRLAAQLYAATIAAALAHHGVRLSTQSPPALRTALSELASADVSPHLRTLAEAGLKALGNA